MPNANQLNTVFSILSMIIYLTWKITVQHAIAFWLSKCNLAFHCYNTSLYSCF